MVCNIKCVILQRFVGFTAKLSTSCKKVVRDTYNLIGNDCRSTTGSNLRHMLECGKDQTKPVSMKDIAKTGFHPIPAGEEWRVEVINELVRIRDGSMTLIGWNLDEIQEMLSDLCTT